MGGLAGTSPVSGKDLENELARRTHLYQRLLKKMDQKHACLVCSRGLHFALALGFQHFDSERDSATCSARSGLS